MGQRTEQALELFAGFNSADPEQLLKGLMRLFTSIASTQTTDTPGIERVVAILHTTEFVEATNPDLTPRLAVIKKACLNKLRECAEKSWNNWLKDTLSHYKN